MSELPLPLVESHVDLRAFEYLPLHVARLRDSGLAFAADAEVFRGAVLSWCVSWHQVPAASLPDNDAELAYLMGYGRDVVTWQRLREAGALRGFIKCSDGRLYHPFVAQLAATAWDKRHKSDDEKAADRERKRAKRAAEQAAEEAKQRAEEVDAECPPDVRRMSGGIPADVRRKSALNRSKSNGTESNGTEPNRESLEVSPDGDTSVAPQVGGVPFDAAIMATALWNDMVERANEAAGRAVIPRASAPTPARKQTILARLKDCGGIDGWDEVMRTIEASDFLCGRSKRSEGHENWRPALDWVLKASNFTKIRDGAYSGKGVAPSTRRLSPGEVAQQWLNGADEEAAE